MTGRYVLDSFALLAFLEDEPGAERVQQLLAAGEKGRATLAMSLVNWGEVLYALQRSKGAEVREAAIGIIDQLPIDLVPPDRQQARAAADLKARHSVAYADCFAAALARARDAAGVTGDPEFKLLEKEARVVWLDRK